MHANHKNAGERTKEPPLQPFIYVIPWPGPIIKVLAVF